MENNDMLKKLFELRKEFQMKSGNGVFPRLDGDLVAQFALGLISELGEVLQEYKGWKPWKNSDCYTYNKDKTKEELIDVWNFLINLSLALGYDAKDIYEQSLKSNEKLLKRFKEN